LPEKHAEKREGSSEVPEGAEPPPAKKPKRRRLRKKVIEDESHRWEVARRDPWLRELLTNSSESETEEKYARFAESGRWIAEMTRSRDKECRKQKKGMEVGASCK
jgi:hypothetical protein